MSFFLASFVVHRLGETEYGIGALILQLTSCLGVFDVRVRSTLVHLLPRVVPCGGNPGCDEWVLELGPDVIRDSCPNPRGSRVRSSPHNRSLYGHRTLTAPGFTHCPRANGGDGWRPALRPVQGGACRSLAVQPNQRRQHCDSTLVGTLDPRLPFREVPIGQPGGRRVRYFNPRSYIYRHPKVPLTPGEQSIMVDRRPRRVTADFLRSLLSRGTTYVEIAGISS
jgi:hypothetical protein